MAERKNGFGERIARIRTAKNLSQEKLAAEAGISRNAMNSIENGSVPQVDKVIPLCNVLGISPNEMFGFEGDPLAGIEPELAAAVKEFLKYSKNSMDRDMQLLLAASLRTQVEIMKHR